MSLWMMLVTRACRGCRLLAAACVLGFAAPVAAAHEFWLEPAEFTPKIGQRVPIGIYIGQNFKGDSFPFLREEFKRFVVIDARGEKPVKGIAGDDPAVTMTFSRPGLVIFAHYSTPESLTFETWEKFESYLQTEGLEHIAALHRAEGKPETGIKEIYSRCAKLLIDVARGAGEDRLTGMPLELVAERNPYRLGANEPLPVRLFHDGKPVAGVLITAFAKANPENKQRVRTDAEGRAAIALPVSGPWLLNAVFMQAASARENAHWTSLWASLTFARP
jgi:hypothetical protein